MPLLQRTKHTSTGSATEKSSLSDGQAEQNETPAGTGTTFTLPANASAKPGRQGFVCALHEQRAPVSKVWKKIKNTNKLLKGIRRRVYFSRGCKSLMCGVMPETLANGKVVYREVCTDPERSGEHDRRE